VVALGTEMARLDRFLGWRLPDRPSLGHTGDYRYGGAGGTAAKGGAAAGEAASDEGIATVGLGGGGPAIPRRGTAGRMAPLLSVWAGAQRESGETLCVGVGVVSGIFGCSSQLVCATGRLGAPGTWP